MQKNGSYLVHMLNIFGITQYAKVAYDWTTVGINLKQIRPNFVPNELISLYINYGNIFGTN